MVAIDLVSSLVGKYYSPLATSTSNNCYIFNNFCVDFNMIMHKIWYYITWPSLQLKYEPAFPGRVVCNKIFSALLTGGELETIGARIQQTWNVIQAIYWKESRWLRSAFYKRIEAINHLINSFLDFWIQVRNLNFEDIFTGARFRTVLTTPYI